MTTRYGFTRPATVMVAKVEKLGQQIRNAESVIVTGADHFFTKQLDAVEETMRGWAMEVLEG